MIAAVAGLADHPVWAADMIGAPSALLLALLAQLGSRCRNPGPGGCQQQVQPSPEKGKTDANDAYVIAQTIRLRCDLNTVDRAPIRRSSLLTAQGELDRGPGHKSSTGCATQ